MPFSDKSDLVDAIISWMDRTDITGDADDFITLAEAGLNRELAALEVDTTLTGTLSSRVIDISGLSINVPISLWLSNGVSEVELLKLSDGDFPYTTTEGKPSIWSVENETIQFERPLDSAYSFRLHHSLKFSLVDNDDTNWLLENHPDVYLSAAITWGAFFAIDSEMATMYGGPVSAFVASVNQQASRRKKGKLTVDGALITPRRRQYSVFMT